MTRSTLLLALTLTASLAGGAALAQSAPAPTDPAMPETAQAAPPMTPTDPTPAPMAAPMTDPANATGPTADAPPPPIVTSTVVANAPIPDTAANRAKYGGPKSHAGKHTKPTGN